MGQPGVRPGPTPPEGEVSGHSKTNGADVRQRPKQARRSAAAPWREETAEALRCGAAWCASWPSAAGRGSEPQPWGPGRPSGVCRATGSSKPEGAALAQGAGNAIGAAVHIQNVLHNGQPQAGAHLGPLVLLVHLVVALPDVFQLLRGMPSPVSVTDTRTLPCHSSWRRVMVLSLPE